MSTSHLEIIDTGILFINPDPSRYHVFASHAHPVQCSPHEFVATYQRGSAIYAADMQIALTRSLDGGTTWKDEGPIHNRVENGRAYAYHDGFLSRMRDGSLQMITFRVDRTDADLPMFSATGGIIDIDIVRFSSDDNGRNWSSPTPIPLPTGIHATPANPIVELPNGQWLITLDRWHGYDEPGPYRPQMIAMISSDRGVTWQKPFVIADGNTDHLGYWHGKTLLLQNGMLYTTFWTADLRDETTGAIDLPIHQVFAAPNQRSWSSPQSTGLTGQTQWPTELSDGRLAMIITRRSDSQPGFFVALSPDGGKTWDQDQQVQIWDASGWTHLGLNAPDVYPHSHDTIAFGAPTLMTTTTGELYASWWCTYASITHIRWAKLRTT